MYSRSNQHPRTCILVKKGFQSQPLMHNCSRDITAVKITTSNGGVPREIVVGSAYHVYEYIEHSPPRELERGESKNLAR
jgi:hypothetical protein